ncbi:matrix-remodeling-associated protein 7 isoform X3 [Parambassis ranga]|uniref:Matrix-remodeling-associated protein 7 isoform X3 n=1 Tax=Parambassis ranga TaxID=210632 RepID=A0A6P7IFF9_9TELE|nr:matrix-remodeling-associated protein 7-like isoform X3 [Parambassis ranga]
MDVTFVLSAIIFTLLAIVVATSFFSGSTSAADFASARSYFGQRGEGSAGGSHQSGAKQNGHVPEKSKKKAVDDWCEISGSCHDHWDVVKSVQSEEAQPRPHPEDLSSTSSLATPRPGSSLETEGATESPAIHETQESNNSLKYVPGKARSHHLEMMMSKEELEEERRVQCEQLAAIFQLLKENKETFGDVTEGDMEEQLQLYSI